MAQGRICHQHVVPLSIKPRSRSQTSNQEVPTSTTPQSASGILLANDTTRLVVHGGILRNLNVRCGRATLAVSYRQGPATRNTSHHRSYRDTEPNSTPAPANVETIRGLRSLSMTVKLYILHIANHRRLCIVLLHIRHILFHMFYIASVSCLYRSNFCLTCFRSACITSNPSARVCFIRRCSSLSDCYCNVC